MKKEGKPKKEIKSTKETKPKKELQTSLLERYIQNSAQHPLENMDERFIANMIKTLLQGEENNPKNLN